MCLFCSFRSSFQNSACSFQKQRKCRYSNFPVFIGILAAQPPKKPKYQAFRRIRSTPKLPSKITKQPLTHKTRNQVAFTGSWVRIPPLPPSKNPVTMRFSGFFFFMPTPKIIRFSAVLSIVLERTAFLFIPCIFSLLSPTYCRNPQSQATPFR